MYVNHTCKPKRNEDFQIKKTIKQNFDKSLETNKITDLFKIKRDLTIFIPFSVVHSGIIHADVHINTSAITLRRLKPALALSVWVEGADENPFKLLTPHHKPKTNKEKGLMTSMYKLTLF
ncbi:hypothetical protein ILYODFUR_037674 [Ilyodon furcidens]|uniref:Uncharacterized protein n=1 Tax=Ilyodon furcidens TaxID=33524 RepID=A0ABV0UMB8_9TELE